MKVLVFGPYALQTPHFETELEVMEQHIDAGDEVVFLACNAEFPACDPNVYHKFDRCMECFGSRTKGLSLLSKPVKVKSFYNLTADNKRELATLRMNFSNIDELKAYKIENFDIGLAVASTLISFTRNPTPAIPTIEMLVKTFLVSAYISYRSVQNHLGQLKADRVYIYNGRTAITRGALRACESRKVQFFTHERAHNLQRYRLFENTLPHDRLYTELNIRKHWELAADKEERERIGTEFYVERPEGLSQGWLSFIGGQEADLLPSNWDANKTNIAIYIFSEDERAALGEVNPLYQNQLSGLQKIIDSLSNCPHNIHLYLRVHPNLKAVSNDYLAAILDLKSDFLTVIPPDSPVSTYALLEHADKVLTFGTTVGIEAVYWGKPSILAGICYYRNLGGTYNPSSHEELIELLKAELKAKGKEAALMYGYYMKTFGVPFRYFRATDVWEGEFKGQKVRDSWWASAVREKTKQHWRIQRLADALIHFYTSMRLNVKLPT